MANQGGIPIDYLWRGCSSKSFEVPLPPDEDKAAQLAVGTVYYINTKAVNRPLSKFVFRNGKYDIQSKVYRWDNRSEAEIFRTGFLARPQGHTNIVNYYSLEEYITQGGFPLVPDRQNSYGFVSTSLDRRWIPVPHPGEERPPPGQERTVYRYEIYAPGGILVRPSLGDKYRYQDQKEVSFVDGIAPRYIRSALRFKLGIDENGIRKWEPANNILLLNCGFNPVDQGRIQEEDLVTYYQDPNGENIPLEDFMCGNQAQEQEQVQGH